MLHDSATFDSVVEARIKSGEFDLKHIASQVKLAAGHCPEALAVLADATDDDAAARLCLWQKLRAFYADWHKRLDTKTGLDTMCRVTHWGFKCKGGVVEKYKNKPRWQSLAEVFQDNAGTRQRILYDHHIIHAWLQHPTVDVLSTFSFGNPNVPVRQTSQGGADGGLLGRITGFTSNGNFLESPSFLQPPQNFVWDMARTEVKPPTAKPAPPAPPSEAAAAAHLQRDGSGDAAASGESAPSTSPLPNKPAKRVHDFVICEAGPRTVELRRQRDVQQKRQCTRRGNDAAAPPKDASDTTKPSSSAATESASTTEPLHALQRMDTCDHLSLLLPLSCINLRTLPRVPATAALKHPLLPILRIRFHQAQRECCIAVKSPAAALVHRPRAQVEQQWMETLRRLTTAAIKGLHSFYHRSLPWHRWCRRFRAFT